MRKQITILQAMDDPKLFKPWFRGKSWGAWRAFLAALFALEMSPESSEVFTRHTGRQTAPTVPFREAWLCCGRRAGKSLIAALIAVYIALFRNYTQYLAPGEVATVLVIAADRKQARTILRYVRAFVRDIPLLSKMITREMKESIEFSNRTAIEVHTASFRTVRGYSVAAALNDEIAFFLGDEQSVENAAEIIAAERPAMATLPGALLLSLSSPHARRGPLWDSFKSYYGKDESRVLYWKADSLSMNPKLDPAIIEEAYVRDPVAAAAEFGAEFRSDCDAFVPREVVDRCVAKERIELPFVEGTRYYGFCDPSGGSSDSMTLAIAHRNNIGHAVLDVVRESKPPFSPDKVCREFAATLKGYGISQVVGDAYAGEWPRERFTVHGIQYVPSQKSRSEIYLDFLPLLNSRRADLLDIPRLANQLAGLERRASRGGRESIDHAPGSHDDVANCAAGALVLAENDRSNAEPGFLTVQTGPGAPIQTITSKTGPIDWKDPKFYVLGRRHL
jgi:terminase large subunit-like protein